MNPDTLMGRADAAAALTAAGYTTSPATLATRACRGGGPVYRVYGGRVLYRWGDCLTWAESRTSRPIRTASERFAADGHGS